MTSPQARTLAAVSFGARIAFGAGLLAAPVALTERWLGSDAATAPVKVPVRALGTREVALNGAALLAFTRGGALRPWLLAGIACDLTDVVVTLAGRRQLPAQATGLILAVGGTAALATGAVALAVQS